MGFIPHFHGARPRHSFPTPGDSSAYPLRHPSPQIKGPWHWPPLSWIRAALRVGMEEGAMTLTFQKKGSSLCSGVVSGSLLSWMDKPQGQVSLGMPSFKGHLVMVL